MSDPDDAPLDDRDALLSGRSRRRAPHLLFLLESWSSLDDEDIFALLESTDVLSSVPRDRLRDLLPLLEPLHVAAGALVVREGEAADSMFLVGYGRLRTERRQDDRRDLPYEIGPGGTVGEAAMITETPHTASVVAVRDSLVLRLSRDGLKTLAEWHPDLPLHLARHVLQRTITTPGRVADPARGTVTTLAISPAGGGPLAEGFVESLAPALAPVGSVIVLSSGAIDASLGEGMAQTPLADARNGRLVEWLQRNERAHGLVLYVTDPGPTNWTRRCLRQADRVLLVARADGAAEPGAIENELLGADEDTVARRELVLLHRRGTAEPSGSEAWLRPRAVTAHHHVREGDTAHFRRVARLVTGRGVGVVFGGGGARGSAHLGVVQALEEAGVPVDAVGGTSIGAVASFMCAMGWDHDARMDKLPLFFSTRLLIQPTIPLVSLSSGRRLQRRIDDETGGRAIEDLWIRFFSVSTNLSQATQVIHDKGDLSLALRASVSLPGVLPPVQSGTDLLVDGGLLNNLPIDVMHSALGGGRVVAVDLRRQVELRMRARMSPALSGWQVLARRLWPATAPFDVPSVGAILQRSVELAGLLNERTLLSRRQLDLYLRPPVGRFGTFDFASAPTLVHDACHYTEGELTEGVLARLVDPQPTHAIVEDGGG